MLFGPKNTFLDGNQWTYQIWPVQFVHGRTGDFEEFSIDNTGSPLKKSNFQYTYFPGLYTFGKYLNWNLKICPICTEWEIAIEFFKVTWGVYTRCTGKVWYVRWFLSQKMCFGHNGRVVHHWEVSQLEFKKYLLKIYISYGEVFKSHLWERTQGVQVKSGMYIESHLEMYALVQKAQLYTFGKYLNCNLEVCAIIMYCLGNSHNRYREFFKVTCGSVQVKSGMYDDSHSERCVLVPTTELYTIGKYLYWYLKNITYRPILAMGNFSKSPVRAYASCTGEVWYVHWFSSGKVCSGPKSRAAHLWEVSELEFKNMSHMYCMGNSYNSYREFFKVTCGRVH